MSHYRLVFWRYIVSVFVIVLVPHFSADAAGFISGLREKPEGFSSTSLLYLVTIYLTVFPVPVALLIWHLKIFILEKYLLPKEASFSYFHIFKIPSLFFYTAMPSKETFGLIVLVLSYSKIRKYLVFVLAFFKPHLSVAIIMRNHKTILYIFFAILVYFLKDEILSNIAVISGHFSMDGTSTREFDLNENSFNVLFQFFASAIFNTFFIWSPLEVMHNPLLVLFWIEALYCVFMLKKASHRTYAWLISELLLLSILQSPLSAFNPGSAIRYRTWIFLLILFSSNYNKVYEKVPSFKTSI